MTYTDFTEPHRITHENYYQTIHGPMDLIVDPRAPKNTIHVIRHTVHVSWGMDLPEVDVINEMLRGLTKEVPS